jgi:hypothetical protein
LNYDALVRDMVAAIPEARLGLEREKRWWGGDKPGAHVVFGNVLVALLKQGLDAGDQQDMLARAFAFVEKLASHQSLEVREIASQSILEPIADEERHVLAARPYLGPNSLQMLKSIGDFWGIDHASDLE